MPRNFCPAGRGIVAGVVLTAVLMALPALARAEAKPIGLIDSKRIAKEYGAARDAQEQVQRFMQDLEKQVAAKERDLQRTQDELESQKLLLGEQAFAAKQADFEKMKEEYFTFRQQMEQKVDDEYKARIQPVIDQIRTIAERLAKEEGYALILDAEGMTIVYKDSSIDLTDKVLAALVSGR